MLVGALSPVPVLLCGIAFNWGEWRRRCPGALPLLLGVGLLALTTLVSGGGEGPFPWDFFGGVVASVGLGWWGYRLQRGRPPQAPAQRLLATLAGPVPAPRALRREHVLGPWQFYVDAALSMVTVELQADGHYSQVIVGNRGERTDCPGGTWTLAGSQLELTAYRSSIRGVTERVRWLFGDWQRELVLFAQDDPHGTRTWLGQRRPARTAGG